MPSSRRPGNRSGPRRTVTRIRNRLWWSIRPYAAGRRARPATVDQRARAGRGAHRRRGRLWLRHVLAGPPPRSRALRVRDVAPRGGDARRGRALHPPPGAGRRARHARRSRVTPAPPDAPPPGAGVRGAGVPVSSSSRGPSCVTRAPPPAPPTVGRQRREHPSADHLRVRVRHAAILRHREGSFHCDGYRHCDGRLH